MTRMSPAYNMTSSRFVTRGSKTRLFAFGCLVLVLCALVYIFHGTQSQLEQVVKEADRCAQKTESLFTQLQGAIENKLRLEKSLEIEKENNKQAINDLKITLNDEQEGRKKDNMETENKYNTLYDRFLLLQNENKELKEQNDSLRKELLIQKEENSKLDSKLGELNAELDRTKTMHKEAVEDLKEKLDQCQRKSGSSVSKNAVADINLIAPQDKDTIQFNSSATPGINPDAVSGNDDPKQSSSTSTTSTLSAINKAVNNVAAVPLPADNADDENTIVKQMRAALNMGGGVEQKPVEMQENVGKSPNEGELNVGVPINNVHSNKNNKNENVGERNSIIDDNKQIAADKLVAADVNYADRNGVANENQPNMFLPAPHDFIKLKDHPANEVPAFKQLKDAAHQKINNRADAFGKHNGKNDYQGGDYDNEIAGEEEAEEVDQDYNAENDGKHALQLPPKHVGPPPPPPPPLINQDEAGDSIVIHPK